jgi:hypothetical protein
MAKRKQQNKDELADALKALTIFLIKKTIKYIKQKQIPKTYPELKAMKERLEQEEANRQKIIRMHEQVRLLLIKKKQRQRWERMDRIRKVKRFLHIPYKTWIEERALEGIDEPIECSYE